MANHQLKNQLFNFKQISVWVDDMRLQSYVRTHETDDLILRCLEVTDFEDGDSLYYEYIVSREMWEEAEVNGNQVIVKWPTGSPLILSFYREEAIILEEVTHNENNLL